MFFWCPQPRPCAHANQTAAEIRSRTLGIRTSRPRASSYSPRTPALNQEVLRPSGPSHSCCSRTPDPCPHCLPHPSPGQVLCWGPPETLPQRSPVPSGPGRTGPDTTHRPPSCPSPTAPGSPADLCGLSGAVTDRVTGLSKNRPPRALRRPAVPSPRARAAAALSMVLTGVRHHPSTRPGGAWPRARPR